MTTTSHDDFLAGCNGDEVYLPRSLITGTDDPDFGSGTLAAGQILAAHTVIARQHDVGASLATGTAAANNGITWNALVGGASGNDVTIALVNPGANNAALAITVTGSAISVSLATGVAGAITTTPNQLLPAIAAEGAAAALVAPVHTGASTGAAAVAAVAPTHLSGGSGTGQLYAWNPAASDGTEVPIGILVHSADTTAGAQSAPYYTGGTFNPDLVVWPAAVQTDSQRATAFDRTDIVLRRPY
jgi:hypothetical protein